MNQPKPPSRGEVWWVAFSGSIGGEIRKTRPAIVVSNDAANHALNRLQVIPLTSKTERLYPAEAIVSVNGEKRKAMANQLTTISNLRLRNRIGSVAPVEMAAVDHAMRIQLAL